MAWTRAIWRLTHNALAGRPKRTRLLALAVAASAALLTAIACAMESLNKSIERGVTSALGSADLRLKRVGEDRFDLALLARFESRPEVKAAAPRAKGAAALRRAEGLSALPPDLGSETGAAPPPTVQTTVWAVDPVRERALGEPMILPGGRGVERPGEAVLDSVTAAELGVGVGDEVEVAVGTDRVVRWRIVGLTPGLSFKQIKRPEATVALESLWELTGFPGRVNEVRMTLRDPRDAERLANQWSEEVTRDMTVEPTAGITAGIRKRMLGANLVYLLISVLGFIASAFIVLTGLTTNLLERQRELAVMRCIGASGGQLFLSQIGVGAALGIAGAMVGVPAGAGLVWLLIALFPDQFSAGFRAPVFGLTVAMSGAVAAGIAGSAWPAWRAARMTPLGATRGHAQGVRSRWVAVCAVAGLLGLSWQLFTVLLVSDAEASFWMYILTGLPAMFVGYFLLGVPACLAVTRAMSGLIARALGVPRALMGRFTAQHPFRNGFTAGALMIGLAMMTVIWTVGGAVFRDFLGGFRFPDAFVQSWNGFDQRTRERIDATPGVEGTCAVALLRIEGERTFGLSGFGTRRTTFIAFEVDPFFRLARLRFEAGDPVYAQRRLNEGGAVLVAKEFLRTQAGEKGGYRVGDMFPVTHKGVRHEFEIVGAVSSPGLELLNGFFDIGKQYAEEAMSAVFGSRADLKRVFGSEAIHLIQVGMTEDADETAVMKSIREIVGAGAVAGSGREVKAMIGRLGDDGLRVASVIAVASMLIACFGVGNIVAAGIDARRYEFGVLRAVGAERRTLSLLILGEVLLVAFTACVLGTLLGLQGSLAGFRMHHQLLGLDTRFIIPWGAVACGWAILVALAALSAWPHLRALARTPTRELIAGRG